MDDGHESEAKRDKNRWSYEFMVDVGAMKHPRAIPIEEFVVNWHTYVHLGHVKSDFI